MENLLSLGAILVTIISTIAGISYTVIKITSIKGNDSHSAEIQDLKIRRAVEEEKMQTMVNEIKDIKKDIEALRYDIGTLKQLIIESIKEGHNGKVQSE